MTAGNEKTIVMNAEVVRDAMSREDLRYVCEALKENGYDPVRQIVGYLLTEDPTYITSYHNARSVITRMDRDDLLHEIVGTYLSASEKMRKGA